MGNYNYSDLRKESEMIDNFINFEKTKIPPFLDNKQTLGSEMGLSMIRTEENEEYFECINFATPSYIFKNEGVIYPFIDTEGKNTLAFLLEANNPENINSDKLVSEVVSLGNPLTIFDSGGKNLGGENFHQTSGFDFSSKTHPGSDSIAFGGLKYVWR